MSVGEFIVVVLPSIGVGWLACAVYVRRVVLRVGNRLDEFGAGDAARYTVHKIFRELP